MGRGRSPRSGLVLHERPELRGGGGEHPHLHARRQGGGEAPLAAGDVRARGRPPARRRQRSRATGGGLTRKLRDRGGGARAQGGAIRRPHHLRSAPHRPLRLAGGRRVRSRPLLRVEGSHSRPGRRQLPAREPEGLHAQVRRGRDRRSSERSRERPGDQGHVHRPAPRSRYRAEAGDEQHLRRRARRGREPAGPGRPARPVRKRPGRVDEQAAGPAGRASAALRPPAFPGRAASLQQHGLPDRADRERPRGHPRLDVHRLRRRQLRAAPAP